MRTGCFSNRFSNFSNIQFLTTFPNTVSEATLGTLPLTVLHLYDLQDATRNQALPNPLPDEAEDFDRGGKHPNHVPLST